MLKIIDNTPKILGEYINGNYKVTILEDGTKIRETLDEKATEFIPEYPESMDVKINNRCDKGCFMCHEDSKPDGDIGDVMTPKFWETLKPYTEIALGGGNPLEQPNLTEFLEKLKKLKLIPNLTVNQVHFMKNVSFLKDLCDRKLIYGLGVSLEEPTKEFISEVKKFSNAVIHVINGIVTKEELDKLANNDLKVLILGYKDFRRGHNYLSVASEKIEKNKKMLYDYLSQMLKEFKVVSFDNLAIEQLDVKRLLSQEEWDSFYMGDDGKYTMYIDLVKKQFASCSVATERFDLLDDIKPMFDKIRSLNV